MSRRFSGASSQTATNFAWSVDTSQAWSMCGWVYVVSGSSPIDADVLYTQNVHQTRLGVYWNAVSGTPGLLWRTNAADYVETVSAGVWAHMGMTYDGVNTLKYYRDGALAGSTTATLTVDTHNYVDVGVYDTTSVIELAHVKYWALYTLSAAEMLAEKNYKAPIAGRPSVQAYWQFEASTGLSDSLGTSSLSGSSSAGSFNPPDPQPVGVMRLTTATTLVEGGVQLHRAASVLVTSTKLVEGGVSSGMRNGASNLTAGTTVVAGGSVFMVSATTLATASSVAPTGTAIKNGSMTLLSGTVLLPITVSAVKNGAMTLATATTIQAQGFIPKFGAATLVSGSRLLPSAAQKLNASVQISTSTHLALVVNMTVAGAAVLRTASQISAYSAISAVAPIWFSDELRTEFTVHTPWTSNPSASST